MFNEHSVFIPVSIVSAPISNPVVDHPIATTDDKPIEDIDPIALNVDPVALDGAMDMPLRGSKRACRTANFR